MASFFAILQALPAFIQSLPYLFQLLLKIMGIMESFTAWAKQNKLDDWLDDLEVSIDKLAKAETPKDKISVGRDFIDIIRRLK
jgi:hypothetical protein